MFMLGDISLNIMFVVKLGIVTWKTIILLNMLSLKNNCL